MVFVEGAFPGERVRAEVIRAKRDYANARAVEILEPSPDRVPIRCDHEGGECPGSPWQPLRYERQLQYKHELVEDALRADRRLRGLRAWSRSCRPSTPGATATRWNTRLAADRRGLPGRPCSGFHARGRWDRVNDARDCCARVGAQQRGAQLRARLVRRPGPERLRPPRAGGLPAQPRRARGTQHGRPAGAARDLRRETSTSTRSATRCATRFPEASFLWTRIEGPAGSTHGGVDRDRHGRGALPRAPRRPRVQHLAGGLLPDQHRDGRAALRPRRRVRRRWPGPSASTTSSAASARSA